MNPLPQLRLRRPRTTTQAANGKPPRLAPPPARHRERQPKQLALRFRQPLPLIGTALVAVALLGYVLVATRTAARSDVLVATLNLPAGTVLQASDLQATSIAASPSLLARLIPVTDEGNLVGRRLAVPATAGVPLPAASVAATGGGPAAFTLTVGALHAVGGDLQPGDRVTVLATFTNVNGSATTRVIARDLVVLAVGQSPTGLDPSTATIPVTVALPDPTVASELALANSVAKVDLLRDGADTTAPIPPATAGATSQ